MKISFEKFIALKQNLKPNTKINILTGSMEPFISASEEIYISPHGNLDEIKMYTPIVFWQSDKLICHCLVKKYEADGKLFFITKGIAKNSREDDAFDSFRVLGIVTSPKMSIFAAHDLQDYLKINIELI